MTTTAHPTNATTPCPPWCSGHHHDGGHHSATVSWWDDPRAGAHLYSYGGTTGACVRADGLDLDLRDVTPATLRAMIDALRDLTAMLAAS